jgi:hypothetical protein
MQRKWIATLAAAVSVAAGCWMAAGLSGQDNDAKKAADAETDKPLLEAVGTLSASHLYTTYLNIGLIADGRAEGIYDEKAAKQLLVTLESLMDAVDKSLEKVAKQKLDKDDSDSLNRIRKLSTLLRRQSKELQEFWAGGEKARGDKYEKTRKESWAGISDLLGLEK